jgi:hypothetical protein
MTASVTTNVGLVLVLSVMVLLCAPVMAQERDRALEATAAGTPEAAARTFGVPTVSHTMQALTFTADFAQTNSFGSRFCAGTGCTFAMGVHLPAGSLVTSIELEACDNNAAAGLTASLVRIGQLESANVPLASVSTGDGPMPTCALFPANLGIPHTIDNRNNTYVALVSINGMGNTTRFQALRVFYHLQVSPPPITPAFNDVPSNHPFFPFVEALVAAGITAGCGGGNYCPDNPVTRGQMAKFLSTALGLHFAP